VLVSVAELHSLVEEQAVVVFDCRFALQDPLKGRLQYGEGHIPGAYYLNLNEDLSSPVTDHGGRHPLPSPVDFARKMSSSGVNENSSIVVYDNGEGMATRAWWLLRYFGHDNVAVLNGGWKAWVASGLPTTSDLPQPRVGDFTAVPREDWVVSVQDVEQFVERPRPEVRLVDARAADRFRGEHETIDPVGGHIPGALNAPWMEGLDVQGFWKHPDEQRKRFSWSGQAPVVVYCGSGVTACANWFAMELAGIEDLRLYAGSWSDWCSYPQHRIDTGDA
jgi:thiosulfate/3-mercaptopyruvate sulfurtransferase